MKSIVLVSHGSYSPITKEEVTHLLEILKARTGVQIFELAFLEVEIPDISMGLDTCVQKGASEVLVLLNFLNSGRHVSKDIPRIVEEARQKHPHVKFAISPPIGQHLKIADLFVDLI
ncbi:MAG: CbiX/SirB N-terminal domain-containing protein, partial [Candidatus Omnitrophica bacterium]|nr:CbiX/SirB N-terminal domain-containing protein [Candidatus Omnitrophota bacterium]